MAASIDTTDSGSVTRVRRVYICTTASFDPMGLADSTMVSNGNSYDLHGQWDDVFADIILSDPDPNWTHRKHYWSRSPVIRLRVMVRVWKPRGSDRDRVRFKRKRYIQKLKSQA